MAKKKKVTKKKAFTAKVFKKEVKKPVIKPVIKEEPVVEVAPEETLNSIIGIPEDLEPSRKVIRACKRGRYGDKARALAFPEK